MWGLLVNVFGVALFVSVFMGLAGFVIPDEIAIGIVVGMFFCMFMSVMTISPAQTPTILELTEVAFEDLQNKKTYLGFFLSEAGPMPYIQIGAFPHYLPEDMQKAYVFYEFPFDCDNGQDDDREDSK